MEKDRFWDASVEELATGYVYDEKLDEYICLLCDVRFENGVIYQQDGILYEAKKAAARHVEAVHGSMFDYMLNMDKKYTGLSEHQRELLQLFKNGLSDQEIVKELNGGSTSTIRNHRFKFKEKEKQAKIYLTIMTLLKNSREEKKNDALISIHKGAKMVDERYAITIEEKEKVLATYFKDGLNGMLSTFPSKEKRKIIVLQHILPRFDRNKKYSEKEINDVLKSIYHDFATIRRYLIEYGFMERSKDCTEYWVK
ncbi:DUF2087 domain-containing protein [Bacillus sp. AGMB 02131]|uniref:DUF2087 domain-containing protein n=1 Tax=Peribacillus faecalis TaxID=2772559 RepID=A0A927D2A9_9BACI|nr:DUF2087 domain-containing protein [Peribacillus faecalis]MBD3109754.1 DUF2087 domain-containing protein [Peribacillus faecalis]